MEAPLAAAALLTLSGVVVLAIGFLQARTEREADRGVAYLRETTSAGVLAAPRRSTPSATGRDDDDYSRRLSEPFRRRVLRPNLDRLAAAGSAFLPADHRAHIRAQLAAAGLEARRRPEEVIAAQVAGGLFGVALGVIVVVNGGMPLLAGILSGLVFTIIGVALPQVWLTREVDARKEAIRRDLPDTLDLLAISVEAGVGLEGAMAVVSERLESPLADELDRTLQEMGLGLSRHDALTNLKHRSEVPELTTFVGALLQADLLGMPIGRVLKIQATEMRSKRRQWSREKAAKLPVKILFPLVACIFPAVLVIVLGPAVSTIGEALK